MVYDRLNYDVTANFLIISYNLSILYSFLIKIILNYRLNLINIFNFISVFYILIFNTQKFFIFSNCIDFNIRTQLNDSSLNLFYYIWTQFFHLPIFFFLVLSIILIFFFKLFKYTITFYMLYTYIMLNLYYNINYFSINYTIYQYFNNSTFNLLLNNSINKYHPLLFYVTSISLTIPLLILPRSYLFFTQISILKKSFFYKILIFILLLVTLYLGS